MTSNKPEVFGVYRIKQGTLENAVLLADYEALQAECENLRKHLQNLIDQTTPLEPVPGNPMWSRRIQLDEVIAERDQLRDECDALVGTLESLLDVQDEDCRYDHQGYCQNHNLDHFEDGCRVARAKTALAAHRKGNHP